jgi:hypothetical protein
MEIAPGFEDTFQASGFLPDLWMKTTEWPGLSRDTQG